MALNQEVMRSYLQRWEAVNEIEKNEQRDASLTDRWQKMNSLLQMARTLDLSLNADEKGSEPWQPWNRLRALYIEKKKDVPS